MTFNEMLRKLRRANRGNYMLYVFCNFVALLLITAYAAMMFSPTVQQIFPEGGDSRKQMTAIFALACVGCLFFTLYAASLFFRMKAREIGALMALGASAKRLAPKLAKETCLLSGCSALLGIVCGVPFAAAVWQIFRLTVVDSAEMELSFDPRCYTVSAFFFLAVTGAALFIGLHYLRRTNIMEVVHEEHRNESVPAAGNWCGPVGIVLLFAGGILGYFAPNVYMTIKNAYPPAWLNLLYVPVFAGLYMIFLHTVSHGWGKRKNSYNGLIARSMMRFQGKQTVNHMLVVALLLSGACFAIFYLPVMRTGQSLELKAREYDYYWNYRQDNRMPSQEEIMEMAGEYGLRVKGYKETEYLTLGMDGNEQVMEDESNYHYEYVTLGGSGRFFSETSYKKVSGQEIRVESGSYRAVSNTQESGTYWLNTDSTLLTNMETRRTLPVKFAGFLPFNVMMGENGCYVLNDGDYAEIAAGLTKEWKGNAVYFNAEGANGVKKDSYDFADRLFNRIVDASGPESSYSTFYDPVIRIREQERGEEYWALEERFDYKDRDSSAFRMLWAYMPKFRALDENDQLKTFAVFFMMFLFIAMVCLTASLVICYTRCMTIALNTRYVFEDLKRLGASAGFLRKEIKRQCVSLFSIPAGIGMSAMYALFTMLLYANDGRLLKDEYISLLQCLGTVGIFSALIYAVYRSASGRMAKKLEIF